MVKYYLHAGRSKMIGIFDGRCALINKEGVCHQCSELNGIFNPNEHPGGTDEDRPGQGSRKGGKEIYSI